MNTQETLLAAIAKQDEVKKQLEAEHARAGGLEIGKLQEALCVADRELANAIGAQRLGEGGEDVDALRATRDRLKDEVAGATEAKRILSARVEQLRRDEAYAATARAKAMAKLADELCARDLAELAELVQRLSVLLPRARRLAGFIEAKAAQHQDLAVKCTVGIAGAPWRKDGPIATLLAQLRSSGGPVVGVAELIEIADEQQDRMQTAVAAE